MREMLSERKNPPYQPYHCFTVVMCKECGEFYEPICKLPHKCKKQNSYQIDKVKEN